MHQPPHWRSAFAPCCRPERVRDAGRPHHPGRLAAAAAGDRCCGTELYDLDRIISRTLAYGPLTALLGGGYAAVALGLGQLLGLPVRGAPSECRPPLADCHSRTAASRWSAASWACRLPGSAGRAGRDGQGAGGGRLAVMVWRSIDHSPGFAAFAEALDRHVGRPPGRGWWPTSRPPWIHGRACPGWPSRSRRCWSAATLSVIVSPPSGRSAGCGRMLLAVGLSAAGQLQLFGHGRAGRP